MNELCSRIRTARRRAGLSQAGLASLLDVNRSSVAQWEQIRGSTPTSAHLGATAIAANVQYEWLATGRGRMSAPTEELNPSDNGALILNYYAHDEVEERVLMAMRKLEYWQTIVVKQLAESLAAGKFVG